MIFPLELYEQVGIEMLRDFTASGFATLPQLRPKAGNRTIQTHLGGVKLDNQFHVAFALSEADLARRVEDIATEYFVPATYALTRFAKQLALCRITNRLPFSDRDTSNAGGIDGIYPRGHAGEIKVTARRPETQIARGDALLLDGSRYSVMQATRDGNRVKMTLDRGLSANAITGHVVKKLRLREQPDPVNAVIVTSPILGTEWSHTSQGVALSFREEPSAAHNALTILTIVLNGGIIINGI